MEFSKEKKCYLHNEEWKMIKSGSNKTAKSRKGNLQLMGDIRSGHHETNGDERKRNKKFIGQTRELFFNPSRNHFKGINDTQDHS